MSLNKATFLKSSPLPLYFGVTISSLARRALVEANGDTAKATAAVLSRLGAEPDLLRALVRDAVTDAVGMHVESSMRRKRATIINHASRGPATITALAASTVRSMLDFPIAGGLRLRFATRAQVLEQADGYAKSAKTATHNARFLQAVAKITPVGKCVGDVLNEASADKLYRETK